VTARIATALIFGAMAGLIAVIVYGLAAGS
jgi:hypothetical protein